MAHHESTVFNEALETMNRALDENRERFPYKQLIAASEKLMGDRKLGVAVYQDDPNTPHDYYTLGVSDGRLEMLGHGKQSPSIVWKVPTSYLKKVADNPDDYVEHPEKLDLDWLKARLDLGGEARSQ